MFEETLFDASAARRCAQKRQAARLQHLEAYCPSGLHKEDERGRLPCFSRSSDPCWCYCEGEVLWMNPIYFDEGKKK